MNDKLYIAKMSFTFREHDFKSATKFNLRMKYLIEKALGDFVNVECKGLKEYEY